MQDNYVVQWGINESDKPLPKDVVAKPPAEYHAALKGLAVKPLGYADAYAPAPASPWMAGRYDPKAGTANLTHCYGYVGVGRDLSPDTGTGGELYAVIGHAPRRWTATCDRRPGDRRDRADELTAARDRSARLLQGRKPERADRLGPAGERHPGG